MDPGEEAGFDVGGRKSYGGAFQFHEKARLQLRANAYNLTNTPVFGGPNTTSGVIGIGQVNDPRIVELGLKLNF